MSVVKGWFGSLLFLGAALYVGVELYTRYVETYFGDEAESGGVEGARSFPADMTIVSLDGRRIDVTLIARSEKYVQFVRRTDGKRFVYDLMQLENPCRLEILEYPITGLENAEDFLDTGALSLEEVYKEQLRVRIGEIDGQIERLESEYLNSNSKVTQRTIYREIESLLQEKQGLSARMAY